MDLSAVIFVALAVAWAVYLVPKALQHHDEAVRSRSVDRFSHTMRVLARREPVSARDGRLVVTPARAGAGTVVTTKASSRPERVGPTPAQVGARRAAARRATQRRRRVLLVLLAGNAVVAALAVASVLRWPWQAVPVGLVVVWLVLCRLMVRDERASWDALTGHAEAGTAGSAPEAELPERFDVERNEQGFDEVGAMAETSAITSVSAATLDPALWDPVPVTLPTYVGKPAAVRRSVRTIDLESTGVWTSGRTAGDAAIAREADAAAAAERAASGSRAADCAAEADPQEPRTAVGS